MIGAQRVDGDEDQVLCARRRRAVLSSARRANRNPRDATAQCSCLRSQGPKTDKGPRTEDQGLLLCSHRLEQLLRGLALARVTACPEHSAIGFRSTCTLAALLQGDA